MGGYFIRMIGKHFKKNPCLVFTAMLWVLAMGVPFETLAAMKGPYSDLFDEAVTIIETHFYNPDQITREFPAIKKKYRRQLTGIATREEFCALMNAMLNELKASHTYYLTPDDYEYYQLAALFSKIPEIGALFQGRTVTYPSVGIISRTFREKTFIGCVLAGSIAEKAGLLKGDEILSVNGAPYQPVASLRAVADGKAAFEIRRQKQAAPINIAITPQQVNPKQEMLAAQKASVRIMEQAGKRIGYIHIYSYAGEEYHRELINALVWGELKDADALIIDLRYGLGGAWPYYLNIFNRNIPVLEMIDKDGKKSVVDSQWRKPSVYLVNAFSRSGKELLVFGARKYKLATVMGEATPGHTLGGRLFTLSNKDLLFLAVQHCFIDGVNLEGVGVEPDIEVPFDIRYCQGKDVQIEKAVEYLIEQLPTNN